MNYASMTPALWKRIDYFSPDDQIDNFGDPYRMDVNLIFGLDALRKYTGRAIVIHCGYEKRPTGFHPHGMAVDCHIVGLHPFDQFIAASRFEVFNGIGIYPKWHSPGLHLDTRPYEGRYEPEARWGCKGSGIYVPIDWNFVNWMKAAFLD
uniref:Peptidase n=1 Tax=viral metagenome TaxID=1070528 RepID=A0A6M3LIC7_9ZZZZ